MSELEDLRDEIQAIAAAQLAASGVVTDAAVAAVLFERYQPATEVIAEALIDFVGDVLVETYGPDALVIRPEGEPN